MRLNKFLAQAGLGSRRSVEEIIFAGLIRINGTVEKSPGYPVDLKKDVVFYDGNQITSEIEPTYIALNKPVGYICSKNDEKGRSTVHELVRTPQKLFTIGRLDKESEGLILLTNDGDFANRLIHPRAKIAKKYIVVLKKPAPPGLERKFQEGIFIERNVRVTGELKFPNVKNRKVCVVSIVEGRNRQIRKMFVAFGLRVHGLQRVQIGPLKLGSLALGSWRYLSANELAALNKAMGLAHGNSQ